MPNLNLKTSHKPVRDYYVALKEVQQLSLLHEGAVAPVFANLLRACASRMNWTLAEQHQIPRKGRRALRADGVFLDEYKLRHGVWEAKDTHDNLDKEVKKKFREGYPQDNILFQAPDRAILVQNGRVTADEDITKPDNLVRILKEFCEYQPPAYEQWEVAIDEFRDRVPELAASLLTLIDSERTRNKRFRDALSNFQALMRDALNPNLSDEAVEEMLIQHLLTERIFRKVFDNPDFAKRNIIAREIEKVIDALTSRHFSRHAFLGNLDRFYGAIEATASTIESYSEKQEFLNTVYENFFQGFSVQVADTHGIVYTPQPIVDFMVRSVDDILQREFGKADGLASDGVAILDPFVGTGNFLLRVMRQMPKSRLPYKYANDLFCNEVMLLPYYIASMNIEHEYYTLTGRYAPFDGISLVDTFELTEGRQMSFFDLENTQRVQRQKDSPIFVVIGNPPYNAHQLNENDNNKNRKYPVLDERVSETYAQDSQATNKSALSDVYVKAIRWAADRIEDEGMVAFITNNSFIDGYSFDGMRKHIAQDFDAVYVVDLGGNARKGLAVSDSNVFGIRVGVSINIFVKQRNRTASPQIFYYRMDEIWKRDDKFAYLEDQKRLQDIQWQLIEPDAKENWIVEGYRDEFESFISIGTKEGKSRQDKAVIFRIYSNGVQTNRDAWVYNSDVNLLAENVQGFMERYNVEVGRWHYRADRSARLDDFLITDDTKIKWSSRLKECLLRGQTVTYSEDKIRQSMYRPFCSRYQYLDEVLTHRRGQIPIIFPTVESEQENRAIWLKIGSAWPMFAVMVNKIPDQMPQGGSQCFSFYTYDEDGGDGNTDNRRENITDWGLAQYRAVYATAIKTSEVSKTSEVLIAKWDIFHYIYALLHHPAYRETYAANLRRELPRIPFVQPEHFWAFVETGRRLAHIHVHYEDQPQYALTHIETPDEPLDYRVEKMRLSKDRTELKYNDFLTLTNIPAPAFEYKLGNRSALHWVIDQYRVKTDKRSGIVNDPNNLDDETYILRLIGQVITVSMETVELINALPPLDILEE